MKSVILGLLLAAMMYGEAVHFGANSKVFHTSTTCSAKGGKHKLTSERSVAEAHGMRLCKRCAGHAAACTTDADCEQKAAAAKAKKGNGAWAKTAEAK
jgi:methylphosphotriester-DNA--protein-cysteine methyltransferase